MLTLYKLLTKTNADFPPSPQPLFDIFFTQLDMGQGRGWEPLSLSAFAISAQLLVSLSRLEFTTVPWGILADVRGICALQIILKHPGRDSTGILGPALMIWLLHPPCESSERSQQWQMTANCSAFGQNFPLPENQAKNFHKNGNFNWAGRTICAVELILQFPFLLWNKSSSLKWLERKYINLSCLILNPLLLAISLGSMTAQILVPVVAWDASTPQ